MSKDKTLSDQSIEALRARFHAQSRKAQAYYSVMHQVQTVVGTEDAASAWMTEPLPALGGKTPAQLVSDGRADEVLTYIASL